MTKVVQARNSIQSLSSSRVPSVDLLAFNDDYLSEQLAGWDDRPFVRAEMQVEDETGRIALASREDLLDTQGVTLLTGLPGSGKTTLLAWAASQRRGAGRGISVFIQLDEYARSGLSSIYEYAADQMQRGLRGTFQLPAGLNELRVAIIEQDRHGTLLWMVDGWDRLHPDERDRVLAGLSGLTHALVATTDTQEFIRRAKARSMGFPRQIYHVLPWGQSQQAEYLAQTARSQPSFGYDSAVSLTKALPGLARLPAGMAYLTRHGDPSLTKTLLGFLDSQQQTGAGRRSG